MSSKPRILIVDDLSANRMLLSDFIDTMGYAAAEAPAGAEALERLREDSIDLVLLDIVMPGMSGYEVLERIRGDQRLMHVPVIVISGVDDTQSIARCIHHGADDYLTKPFNPTLLHARISACLERKRLHDYEREYKRQIEEHATELEVRVREQVERISSTQLATIFAMSKLAESRDPETGEHLERMREYARILAARMRRNGKYRDEIDDRFVENIYAAAPLHDIGKVGIPDAILRKPGKLTPAEFDTMKLHTLLGADTLAAVDREHPGNAFVRMGIEIAQSHHEHWDGNGYPQGLSGEDIPLAARILTLADVYDALTSRRVYKDAFSHATGKAIIAEGRGEHFDPAVHEAFLAEEDAFIKTRATFRDSEKTLIQAPVNAASGPDRRSS